MALIDCRPCKKKYLSYRLSERYAVRYRRISCGMVTSMFRVRPNDLRATQWHKLVATGPTNKFWSWSWKYFFRISDPDRYPKNVQDLIGQNSRCRVSSRSVSFRVIMFTNKQIKKHANRQTDGDDYITTLFARKIQLNVSSMRWDTT